MYKPHTWVSHHLSKLNAEDFGPHASSQPSALWQGWPVCGILNEKCASKAVSTNIERLLKLK